MLLLFEELWKLLTSHLWCMDINGCGSEWSMCRFLRGQVRCNFLWVNCAGVWFFFWYHSVATAWGWRWIIRKFSTCSASSGLLAAIPANITVFTNFISPFISSHSHRILLFLSFCWFCAVVSILGLWAVSYVELQTNWSTHQVTWEWAYK